MTKFLFWVFIALSLAATACYAAGFKGFTWELPAISLGMAVVAHLAIRRGY